RFFQPTAVLPDAAGNVYVADTHNNAIRKIAYDSSHTVTTIAGALLVSGYADGTGAAARFTDPMGMDWLDSTHIVIGDSGNSAIRILDVTTGAVSTIAVTHDWGDEADGPASSAASFYTTVKTWAGSGLAGADDGPASTASFQVPLGLWRGKDGNVYLVDGSAGALRTIQP